MQRLRDEIQNIADKLQNDPIITGADHAGKPMLVYNAGCGWPGFIIFTILMSLPFTLKVIISQLPWYLLFAATTFTFLFDLRLEVQLSIFLYLNIL